MPIEVLGAITLAVSLITTSVTYADKLAGAPDEQNLSRVLMDTIDNLRKEVILERKARDSQLTKLTKGRIDHVIDHTGNLVSAVRELLGKSGDGFMGGVIWVLRDKDRVMSYQTVLGCLHMSLMAIHDELRQLRRGDSGDVLPRYEDIYSTDNKERLLAGLKRWAETDGKSEEDVIPKELSTKIGEDFRKYTYTEQSKKTMSDEIKRRREEREEREALREALREASKESLQVCNSDETKNRLAAEVRRRRRKNAPKVLEIRPFAEMQRNIAASVK
ncbi:hypothetical protein K440DRAFT_636510 [Wilcoxina mikolae CBS 423.85]|nr:hypothetical protein K440DRAFT_636510 [Wilcoxina mikolae CBS 423.85]